MAANASNRSELKTVSDGSASISQDLPSDDCPPVNFPRFKLRTLFALIWVIAVSLATGRFDILAFFAVGIPVGIIGGDMIWRGRFWSRGFDFRGIAWKFGQSFVIVVAVALCILIVFENGRPWNLEAWLLLIGGLGWTVLLAIKFCRWTAIPAMLIPISFLFGTLYEVGGFIEHVRLTDINAGRRGVKLWCFDLRPVFFKDGANTHFIESQLGPQTPQWVSEYGRSIYFAHIISDTGWSNLPNAKEATLENVLTCLPTEEARQQVFYALTDHNNAMRFHQALLLSYLNARGYPPEYKKREHDWWDAHKDYFEATSDGHGAVRKMMGCAYDFRKFWLAHLTSELASSDAKWVLVNKQHLAAKIQELSPVNRLGIAFKEYYKLHSSDDSQNAVDGVIEWW